MVAITISPKALVALWQLSAASAKSDSPLASLSSFRVYRRRFVCGYAATVQSDVWTHGGHSMQATKR